MQLVKKALIRDNSVPVGQPGPLHIECCSNMIPVSMPWDRSARVDCPTCKTAYDGAGYVIDQLDQDIEDFTGFSFRRKVQP